MKKIKTRILISLLLLIFGIQMLPAEIISSGNTAYAAASTTSDTLEVHYIDVGQGDATLIKCGSAAMLIDAGNNNKGTAVQLYLKKHGVTKLKYIVGTHPDADHIGGLDVIITKFTISSGEVWMPNAENDTATYRDVISAIKYKNLKKTCPKVGKTYKLGSAKVKILGPIDDYSDSNDNSIIIKVTYGKNTFLFTGDASEEAEADLVKNGGLKANVLKIGHHGSASSTSASFLKAVNPTYAVISVGEENTYGHPTADVLTKLRQAKVKVFRTDEQGSIIATSDGKKITFNCSPSTTWQSGEKEGSSSSGSTTSASSSGKTQYVYITATGSKYHSINNCGNTNPAKTTKMTEAEAIKQGYGKCRRCW